MKNNTPTPAAQSPAAGRGQQIESQLGDPRAGEQHMTTTIEALKQRAEQLRGKLVDRSAGLNATHTSLIASDCVHAMRDAQDLIRDLVAALPSSPSLPVEGAKEEPKKLLHICPDHIGTVYGCMKCSFIDPPTSDGIHYDEDARLYVGRYTVHAAGQTEQEARAALAELIAEARPSQPSGSTQGSIEGLRGQLREMANCPRCESCAKAANQIERDLAALAASAGVRQQQNTQETPMISGAATNRSASEQQAAPGHWEPESKR